MKLNPDCIRDILIYVEENTGYCQEVTIESDDIPHEFSHYSKDELFYHLWQCEKSYLIECDVAGGGGTISYEITDLTQIGHSLLSQIRDQNSWNNIKVSLSKVAKISLEAIIQAAIQSQFR